MNWTFLIYHFALWGQWLAKKNIASCLLCTCRWFACWLNSFKGMNYLSSTSVSFPHLLPDKSLSCGCIGVLWFQGSVPKYVDVLNSSKSSSGGTVPTSLFNIMPSSQSSPAIFSPGMSQSHLTLSRGRYMYRECEKVGEGMEVGVITIEHGMHFMEREKNPSILMNFTYSRTLKVILECLRQIWSCKKTSFFKEPYLYSTDICDL